MGATQSQKSKEDKEAEACKEWRKKRSEEVIYGIQFEGNEMYFYGVFKLLKEKKFDEFERLIERNKCIVNNMTYENHYEPTMLIHAVEYEKDNSIVEYLSKLECCDITIPDQLGQTAFHFSACNGNIEAMEYLLQRDRSVLNHRVFQYTALHTAARSGNLEMTKFLLKQPDIDVDIRDYHGETPDCQGKIDKEIVDLIRQHRKVMKIKMKKDAKYSK